jgi:hypothetical protein
VGSNGEYIAFLILGVVLVVIDGQLILRSGRTYLQEAYGREAAAATSITRLVVILFHLIVLGVLALISTINVGGTEVLPRIVTKLGVVLLLLALAHGLTIAILTRIRERQRSLRINRQVAEEMLEDQIAEGEVVAVTDPIPPAQRRAPHDHATPVKPEH